MTDDASTTNVYPGDVLSLTLTRKGPGPITLDRACDSGLPPIAVFHDADQVTLHSGVECPAPWEHAPRTVVAPGPARRRDSPAFLGAVVVLLVVVLLVVAEYALRSVGAR